MRGTVWAVANQLGVVATTPAELQSALLSGPPRGPVRLAPLGHDPEKLGELARILGEFGHGRILLEPSGEQAPGPEPAPPPPPDPHPGDPAALCAADPLKVTAAFEADEDDRGGLRTAWLRAGQALVREQAPADRALVLLAALPPDAPAVLRAALGALAAAADWSVADRWEAPGPVVALADFAGRLLVADRSGTVHGLDERRPVAVPTAARIRALAALPDATLLILDERGRLRTRGPGSALTRAVAATLEVHPGTALAVGGGAIAVGDRTGSVHAFGPAGLDQAALHAGRVTALAAAGPVVFSGGADGAVRRWRPGRSGRGAGGEELAERGHAVVALHAAVTGRGPAVAVAWADGLAELYGPGPGPSPGFRPGPAVRAVAATRSGELVVATDEALVMLRPH
ncbi:hypothetical protein [Streptomyces sp. NPDC047968]|uniref:hypothetical protein n=1 Tax=unclassified Streptomyces TaxID=2593676 RepID=UPI0034424039